MMTKLVKELIEAIVVKRVDPQLLSLATMMMMKVMETITMALTTTSRRMTMMVTTVMVMTMTTIQKYKGGISHVTEKQKNIEEQTWSKERRKLIDKFRVGSGYELRNCEDCWRCDRDVVLAAMASCGTAIEFLAEPLRADKEILLLALKTNRRAIACASAELKNDPDIIAASKRVDDSFFEVILLS